MKAFALTLLVFCSIAIGWFIRSAIHDAESGERSWRHCASWALCGAADVAGILYVLTLL